MQSNGKNVVVMIRNTLLVLLTGFLLVSCAPVSEKNSDDLPINLIPMYGYPHIEKTEMQKAADKLFIEMVTKGSESREEASMRFARQAWLAYKAGDRAQAMRRFNQAWLLFPENYLVHWGFGALLYDLKKFDASVDHYDRAVAAIGDEEDKSKLLTDAARSYSILGLRLHSDELFERANSLYEKAMLLNPEYERVYVYWSQSLYLERDYAKAWEVIKKSRSLGGVELPVEFLEALSRRMPEPKE
jgi:tetratricopeptide (TPR) repeat protein